MNSFDPKLVSKGKLVEVSRGDRWSVCLRLEELGITCQCIPEQLLQVEVNTVVAAVQLWSVVRQLRSSRNTLVNHLECCWHAG